MRICIDIGHARGTGARGNGREEHEVVEWFAPRLKDALEGIGYETEIIDFPDDSNAVDLNKTIAAANSKQYTLGLSLHLDASDNDTARGGHVCFYRDSVSGAKLAVCIAEHLYKVFPGRANTVQARPDGELKSLAVLKKTRWVWALIEVCFITNEGDMKFLLKNPTVVASAIARGVNDYVKQLEGVEI